MVEIEFIEVEGSAEQGFFKRCPHGVTDTVPVRLTNTRQRHRYGLNRPTKERPKFVGAPSCIHCPHGLGYLSGRMLDRTKQVVCVYPLTIFDYEVQDAETRGIYTVRKPSGGGEG